MLNDRYINNKNIINIILYILQPEFATAWMIVATSRTRPTAMSIINANRILNSNVNEINTV